MHTGCQNCTTTVAVHLIYTVSYFLPFPVSNLIQIADPEFFGQVTCFVVWSSLETLGGILRAALGVGVVVVERERRGRCEVLIPLFPSPAPTPNVCGDSENKRLLLNCAKTTEPIQIYYIFTYNLNNSAWSGLKSLYLNLLKTLLPSS